MKRAKNIIFKITKSIIKAPFSFAIGVWAGLREKADIKGGDEEEYIWDIL